MRVFTIVTIATAVGAFILFSKIMKEQLASAHRRLGISGRFFKKLTTNVLFANGLAFHELLQFLEIFVRIEGNAKALAAISAGASCFLVISFKAFGNVVVDDESHIGLVDAHAKGDGSHNHIDVFFKKSILGVATHLGIQSCVIGARIDVVGAKHLGEFFHAFAREAVDDTTHMRVTLDESDDVVIHFSRLLSHFVVEVGAIKRAFILECIGDSQILFDVHAHLVGGSGCECDDGHLTNFIDDGAKFAIFRAEIVSPL